MCHISVWRISPPNVETELHSRPLTKGEQCGGSPLEIFHHPLKNVLNIVFKKWEPPRKLFANIGFVVQRFDFSIEIPISVSFQEVLCLCKCNGTRRGIYWCGKCRRV